MSFNPDLMVPFLSQLPLQSYEEALSTTIDVLCKVVHQQRKDIEYKKSEFAEVMREVERLNSFQTQVEYLDVGGTHFHVATEPLMSSGPHLFTCLMSAEFANERDAGGYWFVDRDSHWFSLVLAYLREKVVYAPTNDMDRQALERDVRYYHLNALREAYGGIDCVVMVDLGLVQTYDPSCNCWKLITRASGCGAAVVGDKLFIKTCGRISTLNPINGETCDITTAKSHSFAFGMAALGNVLVFPTNVSEGRIDVNLSTFNVVTHHKECWGTLSPLRMGFALLEFQGRMLVIGGCNNKWNGMNIVEEYWGRGANKHRRLPDMLQKRWEPAAVVWQGRVVVIGGNENSIRTLNTAEEYDPINKQWRPFPSLHGFRTTYVAAVVNGELFAMGKRDGTVQHYDVQLQRWIMVDTGFAHPVFSSAAVTYRVPPSSLWGQM